jgi:hypothetical protein
MGKRFRGGLFNGRFAYEFERTRESIQTGVNAASGLTDRRFERFTWKRQQLTAGNCAHQYSADDRAGVTRHG